MPKVSDSEEQRDSSYNTWTLHVHIVLYVKPVLDT